MAEMPPFKCLLRRKPDTSPALAKLNTELGSVLASEPTIQLREASVADTWFKHRQQ
jgi:hypothetical protein